MKRFYSEVSVSDDHGLRLDGRPVRTPGKAELIVPGEALAEAVAEEWRAQGERIDPRSMPLTGLSNAAIDRVAPDPKAFARGLAAYAESDLLCYRAAEPASLVARQEAQWTPLLEWAAEFYNVEFQLVEGIIHRPQPQQTIARLSAAIADLPPFTLAPLSPIVTISGSLVIALALLGSVIEPEEAFVVAHLDELWQEEQWGSDELATNAREMRRADFLVASRMLTLL
jgi:chaperone required for assembly of F1-ATPase